MIEKAQGKKTPNRVSGIKDTRSNNTASSAISGFSKTTSNKTVKPRKTDEGMKT